MRDQLIVEADRRQEAERTTADAYREHLWELELLRANPASKERMIEEAVADARGAVTAILGKLMLQCTLVVYFL